MPEDQSPHHDPPPAARNGTPRRGSRRLSIALWIVRLTAIAILGVLHHSRVEHGHLQTVPLSDGETRHDRKWAFADSIERAQHGASILFVVVVALGVVELVRLVRRARGRRDETPPEPAALGCLFDALAAVFLAGYAFHAFMTHALGFT